MKNLSTILMYTLAIGFLLIAYISIIFALSWIINKSSNYLFLYFDIRFQFHLTYIIVSLLIISVLAVLFSILVQSLKSSIRPYSKAWQYEEDYRRFNDYMGDEY